jgi:hypothetical protein
VVPAGTALNGGEEQRRVLGGTVNDGHGWYRR